MTMACQSQSCIEPYLETFIQSFADNNYSSWTIRNYRARIRCLGRIMDAEGIAPCSLTADLAERLARKVEASANGAIKFPTLARQFAQHLIDLGVASPPPVTEAQAIRADIAWRL
jgi:integrase/recombinase XerD